MSPAMDTGKVYAYDAKLGQWLRHSCAVEHAVVVYSEHWPTLKVDTN